MGIFPAVMYYYYRHTENAKILYLMYSQSTLIISFKNELIVVELKANSMQEIQRILL